jgi:acylphosphatase
MIENQQSDNVTVRILVTGHVQGVGYRQSARQQARKLGIEAKALNRPDGSVLLEAQGPREVVDQLVDWAKVGPVLAEVRDVTVINTGRPVRRSA